MGFQWIFDGKWLLIGLTGWQLLPSFNNIKKKMIKFGKLTAYKNLFDLSGGDLSIEIDPILYDDRLLNIHLVQLNFFFSCCSHKNIGLGKFLLINHKIRCLHIFEEVTRVLEKRRRYKAETIALF